ncbi:hypothetical protein GCM10027578_19900 [Spirosoma luteolum]
MSTAPPPDDSLHQLRMGIRNKYQTYHRQNRDRFPTFEYNTNRANYAPLVDSFTEELFRVRQLDPTRAALHIPSSDTLAQLFTDPQYKPGKKIYTTCLLYIGSATGQPAPAEPKTAPVKRLSIRQVAYAGLALGLLAGGYAVLSLRPVRSVLFPSKDLVIESPRSGSVLPRTFRVSGTVSNADMVWVVVKPEQRPDYWPVGLTVDKTGHWHGTVIIGNLSAESVGTHWQLRAFVEPNPSLHYSDTLIHAWPNARLSTAAIDVVRGPALLPSP